MITLYVPPKLPQAKFKVKHLSTQNITLTFFFRPSQLDFMLTRKIK